MNASYHRGLLHPWSGGTLSSVPPSILTRLGVGVPHPWLGGYPVLRYPIWTGVPPSWPGWEGTPSLAGGYPFLVYPPGWVCQSGTGVPCEKDMGPVEVLCVGDGVPLWKGHVTSGSIMGWRWGIPYVWTDRQLWKQYRSHPSDAVGNKSLPVKPPPGRYHIVWRPAQDKN